MLAFDQVYTYQFVLFMEEQAEMSAETIARLPDVVSRPVDAPRNLGLKLGKSQPEQSLVALPTGISAAGLTWRSGFWRLAWSPARIDVHFDARGHAEALESDVVPLTEARKRLTPNLVELPNVVGRINRLALTVAGRATCSGRSQPSQIVAATFFNDELVAAAQRAEMFDASGRANHATAWDLGSAGEVPVNRVEAGTANWMLQNGVEQSSLTWQFDLNTHPQGEPKNFAGDSITGFFERADTWIMQRLKAVQERA